MAFSKKHIGIGSGAAVGALALGAVVVQTCKPGVTEYVDPYESPVECVFQARGNVSGLVATVVDSTDTTADLEISNENPDSQVELPSADDFVCVAYDHKQNGHWFLELQDTSDENVYRLDTVGLPSKVSCTVRCESTVNMPWVLRK